MAADALGIERRILKQVELRKERVRYRQLCDRIENLASELAHAQQGESVVLSGTSDSSGVSGRGYISLIERLATVKPPRETFAMKRTSQEAMVKVYRDAIGKTVFPPGLSVAEQKSLFERLASGRIARVFQGANTKDQDTWMAAANAKAEFYRRAESEGAAVVEVVAVSVVPDVKEGR